MKKLSVSLLLIVSIALTLGGIALADDDDNNHHNGSPSSSCNGLPSWQALRNALSAAQALGKVVNGGLGFHMWGTIVNRDGVVCAVAFTGSNRGDQWPGSRVIS